MLAKLNEMNEKVGNLTSLLHNSCSEMPNRSGIQQIRIPEYSQQPFKVLCRKSKLSGGWTTVLVRKDGSVDFYRFWEHYKSGFGNLTGEFFIGLDKLHHLTKDGDQELLIEMEDFEGDERHAKYNEFVVGSEEEDYKLITVGKYSGDAGDDLRYHEGEKFTTRDRDNDASADNCAETSRGAWWYGDCHDR
ncbi:GH23085 [Drosophila grimshawi]|uniref:GH23085 n=1 Tax=Drosophila grimshawi TaxID=7222 RepID=B4JWP4_DROGR|nr:GH23085 [Drosophila grimshawi]